MQEQTILSLRQEIDNLDKDILELLIKRVKVSKKILKVKQAHNLPIVNLPREEQVIANALAINNSQLDQDLLLQVFQSIIKICRTVQERDKS